MDLELAYKFGNGSWQDRKLLKRNDLWGDGAFFVFGKCFPENYVNTKILKDLTEAQVEGFDLLESWKEGEHRPVELVEFVTDYKHNNAVARFAGDSTSFWVSSNLLKAALNPRGPFSWAKSQKETIELRTVHLTFDWLLVYQGGQLRAVIAQMNLDHWQEMFDGDMHVWEDGYAT